MPNRVAPACRGANRKLWLPILLGAGLVFGAASHPTAQADDLRSELVRTDASPAHFILDELNREKLSLAAQHSEIVLVHFFATWCEPCRDELPALNRLVRRTDNNKVRVITISVAEVDMRVRKFVENLPVDFPVLLDRDRNVAKAWNVTTLPTTFILDRNLKPRLVVERDYDWDRFDVEETLKSFGS